MENDHLILTNDKIFIPGVNISTLYSSLSEVKFTKNSTADNTHRNKVNTNFETFIQFQGTSLFLLFKIYDTSRNDKLHKNPQGIHTKTVLSKQTVRSGSVVFHDKDVSCKYYIHSVSTTMKNIFNHTNGFSLIHSLTMVQHNL